MLGRTDSRQLPVSAAGQDKQARAERVKRNGKNNATGALTWINVLKKGKTATPLVRLSETGRLQAFSDGVFSVTITLLPLSVLC